MRIELVSVRGGRTAWADEAAADYGARIQRWFPFAEERLKPAAADVEAERLLKRVPPRGRLVAFDERGEDLTSERFAALLGQAADDGCTTLVFAIGGAWGFSPSVRANAHRVVRLSACVLNHAVARVVAVEQIYRACTIRAGEPYHHGGA